LLTPSVTAGLIAPPFGTSNYAKQVEGKKLFEDAIDVKQSLR
jgi:hypothetical protein